MSDRRPSDRSGPSRRRYLRGVAAAIGSAGFAGCTGGDGSGSPTPGPDDATTREATTRDATATDAGEPGTTPTAEPTGSATATEGTRTPTATPTPEPTPTVTPVHPGYETTEVEVRTPGGDLLGSVTAAIADTPNLRYLGLSDTESLPEDRGMLFVYDSVGDHVFVMREMDFGLDIVYADGDGVITTIHHAPAPGPDEDGEDQRYPGRGQYVLEVNIGWTTERGVGTGDVLEFALP